MTRVWLSLGANVDRDKHVRAALDALADQFGELVLSPVYDSAAIGFDGNPFLNMVVGIETDWPVGRLAGWLRALEEANGRRREQGRKYNDRTLDIDLLTYGAKQGLIDAVSLPRDEITRHAFVLQPLVDVAAAELHPVLGVSYGDLLMQKDFSAQALRAIPFCWRDVQLPMPA